MDTRTIVHTFATDDPRARLTLHGQAWRAVTLYASDQDDDGAPTVDLIRVTKRGTDYKRGLCCMWESLASFDRFGWDASFAMYCRELVKRAVRTHVRINRGYRQTALYMTLSVTELGFLLGMTDDEMTDLGYVSVDRFDGEIKVEYVGEWSEIRHVNWTITGADVPTGLAV